MTKKEKEEMMAATAALNAQIEASEGYAETERQVRDEYALALEMERAQAEAQLTQVQIAERMGTTQSGVSRILKGRNLSLNSISRFFDACGMEMVITCRPKQVK